MKGLLRVCCYYGSCSFGVMVCLEVDIKGVLWVYSLCKLCSWDPQEKLVACTIDMVLSSPEDGIDVAKCGDLSSDVTYVRTSESVIRSFHHLPRDWWVNLIR